MKTKELIRLLQEEDPSGELECCVGNVTFYDSNEIKEDYFVSLEQITSLHFE